MYSLVRIAYKNAFSIIVLIHKSIVQLLQSYIVLARMIISFLDI